jgi:F0F1-type ATP synthase membrane subunit b/b'
MFRWREEEWMMEEECNNGSISTVLYFWQLAMVAVPQGYRSLAGKWATMTGEFAGLQQLASSKGVCLVQGMTMVDQLLWQLFVPLMPILMLALFVLLTNIRQCFTKACSWKCQLPMMNSSCPKEGLKEPLIGYADEQDEKGGYRDDEDLLNTSNIVINDAASLSEGDSFAGGVACLMLLAFASLSTTALQLLNCVKVGSDLVLFYAGAKQCGVWQLPVYLVVVLLVLIPLVPVCVKSLCLLPRSWRVTVWARRKHWPSHPVMQAIRGHVLEPFVPEQSHWAAVLMLQRLLTVACHALASSELQSELGVVIISVWFLLLQALVQPYRINWVNRIQLLSCWCLVMLTVLNIATNSVFVSLGVDVARTPLHHLAVTGNWMMFVLLWPPIIVLMLCTIYEMRAQQANDDAKSKDDGDTGQELVLLTKAAEETLLQQLQQENGMLQEEKTQLQEEKDHLRHQAAQQLQQQKANLEQIHEHEKEQLLAKIRATPEEGT